MYLCIHVSMYLCVYVSISISISVSISISLSIYIYMNMYICIYTSGAYVAIRQHDLWQETQSESKPCLAASDEALKEGSRRTYGGLDKDLRWP